MSRSTCGGCRRRLPAHHLLLTDLADRDARRQGALDGRSEQYVVYAVLDALVATAYDVLNGHELELQEIVAGRGDDARGARAYGQPAEISAGLTEMRRWLGPQRGLFERIKEEIGQLRVSNQYKENYFERIRKQIAPSSTRSTPPGAMRLGKAHRPAAERDHRPVTTAVGPYRLPAADLPRPASLRDELRLDGVLPSTPRSRSSCSMRTGAARGGRLDRRPPARGAGRRRGR